MTLSKKDSKNPDIKSELLPSITEAVRIASRATRLVLEQDIKGDKWSKEDRTPVTVADLASQAILLGELANTVPDEGILAEEEPKSLDDADKASRVREIVEEVLDASFSLGEIRDRIAYRGDKNSDGRWFVDPLDGTKGFVKNLMYAVGIARTVNGELNCSWLSVPGREELLPGVAGYLFRAERNRGAFLQPLKLGEPEKRIIPEPVNIVDGIKVVVSRAHDRKKGPSRLSKGGMKTIHLPLDSQAKYAALAMGKAHLYPRRHSKSFGCNFCWDHAPGVLLLEETGGSITDLTGRPLDFTKGERLSENLGILAAVNTDLHAQALSILRKYEGK
ncbi:MAG: inositol monophosphatase family protein [Candidatus Electryonea clarkiae]|nr:inositol monophosphatase family protein [Candidatus Electryonea clarkiae]MDP8285688.1 inositol monophosphatase family protein [Candidatus Electryonea clarkiae]